MENGLILKYIYLRAATYNVTIVFYIKCLVYNIYSQNIRQNVDQSLISRAMMKTAFFIFFT